MKMMMRTRTTHKDGANSILRFSGTVKNADTAKGVGVGQINRKGWKSAGGGGTPEHLNENPAAGTGTLCCRHYSLGHYKYLIICTQVLN